jgi:hypothetical protein
MPAAMFDEVLGFDPESLGKLIGSLKKNGYSLGVGYEKDEGIRYDVGAIMRMQREVEWGEVI